MKKKYKDAVVETLKEFNQLEYIKQFNKENYKHYHIKINLKDKAIIDHLEKQPSKNGYLINLIKKDIERGK